MNWELITSYLNMNYELILIELQVNYEWIMKSWMKIHVNEFHLSCHYVQYWHL